MSRTLIHQIRPSSLEEGVVCKTADSRALTLLLRPSVFESMFQVAEG